MSQVHFLRHILLQVVGPIPP